MKNKHMPPKMSALILPALLGAFKKLNPFELYKNPVMFITEVGAAVTTFIAFFQHQHLSGFSLHIAVWLWITVLFATFSEAIAERRNFAQAEALKSTRTETMANRITSKGEMEIVSCKDLRKGNKVLVSKGEIIPADGKIVHGIAAIDESSVTGESAPVIRGAATDSNGVTAGTKVISDEITVVVTANPGEGYLDKMIGLIEGAKRKKTPNELALTIFLAALTFVFLAAVMTLEIFAHYFKIQIDLTMLIAFLVCLIPTTIAGLLSAIGIAGINRLMSKNVLAMSGQAVEAAGDIDLILIDKTGTITLGNRHATAFFTAKDCKKTDCIHAAYLASLEDDTVEGQSIVKLAEEKERNLAKLKPNDFKVVPFSAATRMSGIDYKGKKYRKGAKDAIEKICGKKLDAELDQAFKRISAQGGTPLVVACDKKILGVIYLKDTIKHGLAEKFGNFRKMGQKTVMMTGDNPVTARTIAHEVGVDDFIAEVSPEGKLSYLKKRQKEGYMVAMTGDGVNDAPALAQADVGVAMNAGSQAAKEASNMIDLDSHPTKLFDIIEIGKQLLMTRGALTTFSVANDLAKYFAIIPAMLISYFPDVRILNIMHLATPESAVLSAIIFNALIIVALIPLALRGVKLVPQSALKLLIKNLLIYGLGGVILPFVGIKLIDMILVGFNIV